MNDTGRQQSMRTTAEVRHSWRPGWMWVIPIAAFVVVAWLGIRALTSGGQDISITFDDVHGLKSKDTDVMYRGMQVGKVSGIKLSEDGRHVIVTASIDSSATRFLTTGTRFWLKGANPSLSDLSSLGSVLSGPSIEMEPGPGAKQKHFVGLSRKPVIPVKHGASQNYEISFAGAVGTVKSGAPVMLDGFVVGEVRTIGFRYDASTGTLSTPVVIALYSSLFHITDTSDPKSASSLKAAVARLIRGGLRARLERDPPLVGTYTVRLDLVPGAPEVAPAIVDSLPQIPAAPAGGLDTIVNKAGKIPIDRIAQNVLDITKHIDNLVSSPKLADSIAQMDSTLKNLHETAAKAGPQITELVQTLRRTAVQLDEVTKAAKASVGGVTTQTGLAQTMKEVTGAARSLRALADYLDQHPEALIRGRSGG